MFQILLLKSPQKAVLEDIQEYPINSCLRFFFSKRMLPEIGQGTTDIPSLIHTGVPIVAWRRERSCQRHRSWGLIDLRSQVWTNPKSRLMMIISIIHCHSPLLSLLL